MLRVAVAQTTPIAGDIAGNLRQHLALAEAAARARVRLLAFPELSLTGYELPRARALAFTLDDPRLEPLRELARTRRLTLVVGAPVRLGPRLHIGALIVAPDGALDVYTKRHLGAFTASAAPDGVVPPPEPSVFAPGDRDPLIELAGHRAAVAICADLGRPSHAEAAAARGADLYLACAFVIPADHERERERLRERATRHGMLVAFANFGGPSGGLPSAGASEIWSPAGALLGRLGEAGAGLVIAE
ncbi:MAG: carbon-nitrogen hydrolase family protein, partial [Myxococcales bacterium]|nr:carbon-nitrogen hydrolase family protein [Myxococcales bacterium]